MARKTRHARRRWGAGPEEHIRGGRRYWYYSFPTPAWAFSRWPNLGLSKRQYHSVTPDRAYEGEAWLAAAEKAVRDGTWEPEVLHAAETTRQSITFREYAREWLNSHRKADGSPLKETSKQKYRESLDLYLYDYFGDMPMSSIRPRDIQQWWDTFKPLRADANLEDRRYHVYAHLKAIFHTAATEPIDAEGNTLISLNPCRIRAAKPKAAHTPVRPTREQMDALLDEMPEYLHLVPRICDVAGLREGEALGLCVKHIDFDHLLIKVRQQTQHPPDENNPGHGKTVLTTPKTSSSIGDVRMSPTLAADIRAWVDARGIANDPEALLFPGKRTKLIAPQTYRNAFSDARKKVPGLANLRPHDLRKDCLSRIQENGGTVAEAMSQGRHVTMAVASKYQVTSDEHMQKVMERMDADGAPASAAVTHYDAAAMSALADALAGMSARERVSMLKPLEAEERMKVLEMLPKQAMAETIAVMFADESGRG